MTGPYSPPPLGEPVRWRSSHLLPFVPAVENTVQKSEAKRVRNKRHQDFQKGAKISFSTSWCLFIFHLYGEKALKSTFPKPLE